VSELANSSALIVPLVWDGALCASIRAAMDRGAASAAEIFDAGSYMVDAGTRRAFDVEVDAVTLAAVEVRLASLRAQIEVHFGVTLAAAEGAGFLRYMAGGFYRQHVDWIGADSEPFRRRVSVVLFLSDTAATAASGTCSGGALRLYEQGAAPVDVSPAAGTLVAFPADIPHEVLPVEAGVRDVVVDWFY
jgi:predicted 2-oxoglutarate/Fe(II)-dependent dioxygenase YbiX